MTGKVVICTGCNSPLGIGRASAHQYASNGAKAIYLCDYKTEFLETHKKELASLFPSVEVHVRQVDAGEETDVQGVVDDALAKYGRLDIFFANAGISVTMAKVLDAEVEDFMQVMKTNALR